MRFSSSPCCRRNTAEDINTQIIAAGFYERRLNVQWPRRTPAAAYIVKAVNSREACDSKPAGLA